MQYPVRRLNLQQQRGMGLVEILFMLVMVGFLLIIGVKLGPHYMEFLTVRSVMDDVARDATLADGGKMGVIKTIQNRLFINSVKGVGPKAFSYKKTLRGYQLSVDYQVQEHLFANVDVILSFNHEAVAIAP